MYKYLSPAQLQQVALDEENKILSDPKILLSRYFDFSNCLSKGFTNDQCNRLYIATQKKYNSQEKERRKLEEQIKKAQLDALSLEEINKIKSNPEVLTSSSYFDYNACLKKGFLNYHCNAQEDEFNRQRSLALALTERERWARNEAARAEADRLRREEQARVIAQAEEQKKTRKAQLDALSLEEINKIKSNPEVLTSSSYFDYNACLQKGFLNEHCNAQEDEFNRQRSLAFALAERERWARNEAARAEADRLRREEQKRIHEEAIEREKDRQALLLIQAEKEQAIRDEEARIRVLEEQQRWARNDAERAEADRLRREAQVRINQEAIEKEKARQALLLIQAEQEQAIRDEEARIRVLEEQERQARDDAARAETDRLRREAQVRINQEAIEDRQALLLIQAEQEQTIRDEEARIRVLEEQERQASNDAERAEFARLIIESQVRINEETIKIEKTRQALLLIQAEQEQAIRDEEARIRVLEEQERQARDNAARAEADRLRREEQARLIAQAEEEEKARLAALDALSLEEINKIKSNPGVLTSSNYFEYNECLQKGFLNYHCNAQQDEFNRQKALAIDREETRQALLRIKAKQEQAMMDEQANTYQPSSTVCDSSNLENINGTLTCKDYTDRKEK
jgi:antirestriction protein